MADLAKFGAWLADVSRNTVLVLRDRDSSTHYNLGSFSGWRAAAENCIFDLLGPESIYYKRFVAAADKAEHDNGYEQSVEACFAIVDSLHVDFSSGRLVSLKALVTADVFADFLEMAGHLLSHNYKDASASLIGAVLERGLRDIASANGLTIKDRDDLSSLTSKLVAKGVFNRLVQKNLNVWIEVRNSADHGKFAEYSETDVRGMHSGVQAFLAQHVS
jgi:hypothetical protein